MTRSLHCRLAALALAAIAAVGCSGAPEPPEAPAAGSAADPGATLDEFYRHLNGGDFASAMALYSTEALEVWEDPALAGGASFANWAREQTRDGQVERVRVLGTERPGGTEGPAELDYEVVYADGGTARHSVSLVREEGGWRMGLIR
jgi:hypothetical protein